MGAALDAAGNLLLAGDTTGVIDGANAGGEDIFVMKLDPNGGPVWARQYGTSASDAPSGIALDSSGDSFVVGSTGVSLDGQTYQGGASDAFISKFSPTGSRLWTKLLGTPSSDGGLAVAVYGNAAYVVGLTFGTFAGNTSAGADDAFLAKMDATTGAVAWIKQFGTAMDEQARSVAVDRSGNVFLVGQTNGVLPGNSSSGSYDIFVARYDSAGNQSWLRQLGSNNYDQPNAIATDSGGNVLVAGWTAADIAGNTSAGGNDAFVAKYDPTGAIQWVRMAGGAAADYANAGLTATEGDAVLVGLETTGSVDSQPFVGTNDAVIVKFSPAGTKE